MKVLQLTYRVPYPPTDGGAIGIYNIVKGLHENNCNIDLVSINTPKHSQPPNSMSAYAKQHDVFVNTRISVFKLLRNILFSKVPYNIERFYSKDVEIQLTELLTMESYDFIQLEGSFVLKYIDIIKKLCNTPIIVRAHNIEYIIWERLSINERNPFKRMFYSHLAKRIKRFEQAYYNKADGIAAITEEDKQRLSDLSVSVLTEVIPAGVVLDKYKQSVRTCDPEENTVFFIGALDWLPNLEGLNWFIEKIWPEVLKEFPSVQLHIAGKSASPSLMRSQVPNTTFHGFVDDALIFKNKYSLMLVPLLSGGGMRVKIIEGFAAGKCIISTTVGAEGISYKHGKNIVIADTVIEWKEAIIHYLKNYNLAQEIEREALNSAQSYDNKTITGKYITLYEKIVLSKKS